MIGYHNKYDKPIMKLRFSNSVIKSAQILLENNSLILHIVIMTIAINGKK